MAATRCGWRRRGRGRPDGAAPAAVARRLAAAATRRRAPTPEVVGAQPQPGQMRAWNTFEHVPRYHNNYVGMRNRFALLSEAYAYATFEDRIKATNYFIEESLNFANAERATPEEGRRGGRQGIDRRQDRRHTRAQIKRGGIGRRS